jgi:hypothetical protein
MKIFTFGDGFAHGHIWPEWPQILQAMSPQHKIINTSGIGAGAEFLVTNFVDLMDQMHNSIVIFQWPCAARFDKVLEDDSWDATIDNDAVYHFNRVMDRQNRRWWLSSASIMPDIKRYHDFYVQSQQQYSRMKVWQALVKHACLALHSQYVFASTDQQDAYSKESRFKDLRQNEIQPSPWVHLCWLQDTILPHLGLDLEVARQQLLEKRLLEHAWKPYDPDREQIWLDIVDSLNG